MNVLKPKKIKSPNKITKKMINNNQFSLFIQADFLHKKKTTQQ
jgi:hypothetical protein